MQKVSITAEELNLLPPFEWPGEIIEIVTPQGVRRALEILEREAVVGFDTETRPSFKKGESYTPALLQLATNTQAFVFRLKFYPFPAELRAFLEEKNILKVGVGIADDLNGLRKITPFSAQGFVDIAAEAKRQGCKEAGLRPLTGLYLGQRLSKAAKLTNWEKTELSDSQLRYAAVDAVVGLLIYQKLRG